MEIFEGMHIFLDMTCIIMFSLKTNHTFFKAKSNKKSNSNSDLVFFPETFIVH